MKYGILGVLCILTTTSLVKAGEEDSLYQQLSHAVIRLEHFALAQDGGKPAPQYLPDGTAFFINISNEIFVVTARHIVDRPENLQARVKCRVNTTNLVEEVVLLELPRDKWTYHNNQGDEETHYVDVAVMKLPRIPGRTITTFRCEPKESSQQDKNQLPQEDSLPPQPILVLGYPSDIGFGLLEQRPLVRSGIVSMKTDRKFLKWENKYGEERCCLIDARIFQGNSGSPVMNQPSITDQKFMVLGLVIAVNSSLDFAIMEPVSRIRETLDLAQKTSPSGTWKIIPGGK